MSLLRVRGHGRHIVAVVLSIATLAAATPPTGAVRDAARWSWPLQPDHSVVRGFEPPADPWGPGHRGVDIAGAPGQPVLAVAAGTVTFAGQVAGTGVVVVNHGRIRS
ncbi:MAG TPA: M23 family metallopeptidase, partial [Nocardioidaceae bacterium]